MHHDAARAPQSIAYVLPPGLPVRAHRKVLAQIITQHVMPVSARTLERWPLTWQHGNGKALADVAEALAVARAKLNEAPPIRGGRNPVRAA